MLSVVTVVGKELGMTSISLWLGPIALAIAGMMLLVAAAAARGRRVEQPRSILP